MTLKKIIYEPGRKIAILDDGGKEVRKEYPGRTPDKAIKDEYAPPAEPQKPGKGIKE